MPQMAFAQADLGDDYHSDSNDSPVALVAATDADDALVDDAGGLVGSVDAGETIEGSEAVGSGDSTKAVGTNEAADPADTADPADGADSVNVAAANSADNANAADTADTAIGEDRLVADAGNGISAAASGRAEPSVAYRAHVQDIGWQSTVADGQEAGTTGRALRMEAITVTLDLGDYAGGLQMQGHVQNVGWQDAVGSGETAGTTGRALQLEAVKLQLTGEVAAYYDVYYRAHVSNIGWQDWVSNGDVAGTEGRCLAIEALQVELRKKSGQSGGQPSGQDAVIGVQYQTHVQNIGWQEYQSNGEMAGTTGRGYQVEAVRISLMSNDGASGIEYRVHVQDKGWMPWVRNGEMAGTTGQALQVEAIEIRLTGELAKTHDVVYTAHICDIGWQTSKNNGLLAGTTGRCLRVEALTIQLVEKSKRNGWFLESGNWHYYSGGSVLSSRWLDTDESPIAADPGTQRYWLDSSGNLAVSRVIDPRAARDAGSYVAYATDEGFIGYGKLSVEGGVLIADWDGELYSAPTGWLVTDEFDGRLERYWMQNMGSYAMAKTGPFSVDGSNYCGVAEEGFVLRNGVGKAGDTWARADNDGRLTPVNVAELIKTYVNWAKGTANDDSHGYSQAVRWGPDYDCSSFVISALKVAGFCVGDAVYTGNMVTELIKYGFSFITDLSQLREGDILWTHNDQHQHTEIYLGNNQIVGATSSESGGITGTAGDQTGDEIRIGTYYDMPWMGFLRAA